MLLQLKGVGFSYRKKDVFENLSFQLFRNETVVVLGASGSGKSTLLRLLVGLEEPHRGKVFSHFSLKQRQQIAYMMQQDSLIPWKTLWENVLLFSSQKQEAKAWLATLNLEKYATFYPHQLSEGMKKRVALIQALLCSAELLLLDEPFSALDLALKETLYRSLLQIQREKAMSMLLVTHDLYDAFFLANRIVLLERGQMRREWILPAELSFEEKVALPLFGEVRKGLKGELCREAGDNCHLQT